MAQAQGNVSDVCKNSEITLNLEKMLNNKRYSDTVFLVNKRKYYASSHLVGVSSVELESMLENQYENCGDREIAIGDVKYNESFPLVLRFIYGLDFKMSELSKPVLCEALSLAKRFELKNLVSKLKTHILELDSFEVDSVFALLNTAKQYQMLNLYEKLTTFVYKNVDGLVKHESFAELQYDVLLDLVKANFLFADEIDILRGVLNWHDNNMNENPSTDNDTETVILEITYNEDKKKIELLKEAEDCNTSDNLDQKTQPKVKTEELVKEFSINVLKAVLSHIRYTRISALELFNLIQMRKYSQFKEFLCDPKYFSSSTEPRVKFGKYLENKVQDVSKTFTVNAKEGVLIKSNEAFVIDDMEWTLSMMYNVTSNHIGTVTVYLECSLAEEANQGSEWECETDFQVQMVPNDDDEAPPQYLPGINVYSYLKLSTTDYRKEIGNFYFPHSWTYEICNNFMFVVNFKNINSSIQIKN